MVRGKCTCLDATTWFEGLARLSSLIALGVPLENILRLANHLARLAPPPFAALGIGVDDEALFERMLERAWFEAAAVAVIGPGLSGEILARTATEPAGHMQSAGATAGQARAEAPPLRLIRTWLAYLLTLAPSDAALQPAGASHKSA